MIGVATILVISELSSLSKFNTTSVVVVVALTMVPIVNLIVSITSTAVSFLSLVDIVIEPFAALAGITISLAETVYSVVSVAVPLNVNGIRISFPDTIDGVAVKVTSVDEFSTIFGADNAKATVGIASLSVIVTVTAVFELNVALVTEPGVKMIVSFSSSDISSIADKVKVPEVAPAGILSCGINW